MANAVFGNLDIPRREFKKIKIWKEYTIRKSSPETIHMCDIV